MRALKYPLAIVICFSFVLGGVWGLKIRRDQQKAAGLIKAEQHLHVLAYKNIFSPELLKAFEKNTGIGIALTEAETPEDLWEKMEASGGESAFDLVTLFSYQVPLAFQMGKLTPLARSKIKNYEAVSPDFIELPGDPSHARVLPLAWGLNGIYFNTTKIKAVGSWKELLQDSKYKNKIVFPSSTVDLYRLSSREKPGERPSEKSFERPAPAKTTPPNLQKTLQPLLEVAILSPSFLSPAASLLVDSKTAPWAAEISHGETAYLRELQKDWKFTIPEERALLWILSLALTRESNLEGEVYQFLDFILERESALEILRTSRQASANRQLEGAGIDARLKPSYLRSVPLRSIDFYQDFSRAREIRALLKGRPQA